jgi:hypothetical protein
LSGIKLGSILNFLLQLLQVMIIIDVYLILIKKPYF